MFILKDEIKAWWPVKVKEPNPSSPGTFITHKFEVEFTLINQDEANAMNEARALIFKDDALEPGEIVKSLQNFDAERFAERISNWRGVFGEDKREVAFSREILLDALKRPLIYAAVAEAFEDMASGGRRKN